MSFEHQPTVDEMLARTSAAVAANDLGILRISARRWAVIRRQVSLGRRVVGYQSRGVVQVPRVLVDHIEYEIVEGYDKLSHESALTALYDLTHPEEAR